MLMSRHIVHDTDNLHFSKEFISFLVQADTEDTCTVTLGFSECICVENSKQVVHGDLYVYGENQVATNLKSLLNLNQLS